MITSRVPASDPFAPLFSSDLAREIRDTFEEMIGFGASVTAATQETIHRFQGALHDAGEAPVVILALAGLQVRHRQIHASIRDAALEILRGKEAEKLVASEPASRRKARALLDELRQVLEATENVEEDEEVGEDHDDDET